MLHTVTAPIRYVTRRLHQIAGARALILMYHRVAEVAIDPWGMAVTPTHFAEHLQILKRDTHPISLQTLLRQIQTGKIRDRSVVVTFDDGYADNLHHAKPLLEQYEIPVTIFLATGYIGQAREFWWDELARLLLQPDHLPERLELQISGSEQRWELGPAADYPVHERQRDQQQRPWQSPAHSRSAFHYALWQQLRPVPHLERQLLLDEIRRWSGSGSAVDLAYCALRVKEVGTLADCPLIELGAHTVTHPLLSTQPVAVQQSELQQSKANLEALLKRPVVSFTYPHGDYSNETLKLAHSTGFDCACTVRAEAVHKQTDPFQLPRFEIQNWNGAEFARQLVNWW